MELAVSTIEGSINRISLRGRLDTPSVGRVESQFMAVAVAAHKNAIIDLSEVSFLASMGIRMLVDAARAMGLAQHRMVLFGAQPAVQEGLDHTGLAQIIPIAPDEAQALQLLAA